MQVAPPPKKKVKKKIGTRAMLQLLSQTINDRQSSINDITEKQKPSTICFTSKYYFDDRKKRKAKKVKE